MQLAIDEFLASGDDARQVRSKSEDSPQERVLVSGSFNPLHDGHLRLAEHAARRTNLPVEFDLSVNNVDKQTLGRDEILRRATQFPAKYALWMTRLPTFDAKSAAIPNTIFAVGADTIIRVGSPEYYGGSTRQRDDAMKRIKDNGCRFLVFGRVDVDNYFLTMQELVLPSCLGLICAAVTESEYRCDLSSTAIRSRQRDG